MKVIVCGGRDYSDAKAVHERLQQFPIGTTIIHGGAGGADMLASETARLLGFEEREHKANWKRYGRGAGPKRNQQMLEEQPDLVIAFPGGRGTANMISLAEKAGVPVERIEQK